MDLESLRDAFPHLVFEEHETLAPYTYMKVGGKAAALVEVKTKDDLALVSAHCFVRKIPFVVLGGGSNVVIADEGLDKLVIHNQTSEIEFIKKTEELTEVVADSGVITAVLAGKTTAQELTGFEYFVGIPGTIGGAIVNNSHFTRDDLVGDRVIAVEVMTIQGQREVWSADQLKFKYDYSIFHEVPAVVLSATFLLRKAPPSMIEEHVKKAALKRTSNQPIGVPSSGCMFKNVTCDQKTLNDLMKLLPFPPGAFSQLPDGQVQLAAGFLIEAAGLKGQRVGGAGVSEKHATYILNLGGATAHDIEKLCRQVESTVKRKYGLQLEREVFFLK